MWPSIRGAFRMGVQLSRLSPVFFTTRNLHRKLRTVGRAQGCRTLIRPGTILTFSLGATTIKMEDAIRNCDRFYEAGNYHEAYEAIKVHEHESNPEVQWRLVRMTFKVAEKTGKRADKGKAIQDGIETLQELLKVVPNCPNTHKWIAILLASKDEHSSFTVKIEEAFLIREHLEKAIELNPADGYAQYVLGRWCFQVASVSWLQKKTAAALFASPPESTYEEALEHFLKAEKLNPNIFNACFLMTAKCLLQLGDNVRAEEYLKKCVNTVAKDQEALTNIAEAQSLAKKHKLSI